MSIPKLELCGAVLLAELLQKIKSGLHLESVKTYGWTDSNVVLAWISNHASRWTPFVANRVSKIQSILTAQNWFHVSSGHNPADVATRGITPLQLKNCQQWWHGPYWLEKDTIKYTSSVPLSTILPERKNNITILTAQDSILLLSEENVPPSQWPLGRVIETIKGKDNIVRVVKIKIGSKILTRPVVKLCLMPIPTPRASPDQ
ncbi:hypothetical protein TKK_0016098 [Trichogramma kaykai]